jgi:hypothetical protein
MTRPGRPSASPCTNRSAPCSVRLCSKCGTSLTPESAAPSTLRKGGYCRRCQSLYMAERWMKYKPGPIHGPPKPASLPKCDRCDAAFRNRSQRGCYECCMDCGSPTLNWTFDTAGYTLSAQKRLQGVLPDSRHRRERGQGHHETQGDRIQVHEVAVRGRVSTSN